MSMSLDTSWLNRFRCLSEMESGRCWMFTLVRFAFRYSYTSSPEIYTNGKCNKMLFKQIVIAFPVIDDIGNHIGFIQVQTMVIWRHHHRKEIPRRSRLLDGKISDAFYKSVFLACISVWAANEWEYLCSRKIVFQLIQDQIWRILLKKFGMESICMIPGVRWVTFGNIIQERYT